MNKNILKHLESLPFFSNRALLSLEKAQRKALYENLRRWVDNGDLIRLKNGLYVTKTYVDRHSSNASYFELIAGSLAAPSYLSLEFVLQKNNLITEATYPVTSVTLKTPRRYQNPLGSFVYHHIHPKHYCGFVSRRHGDNTYYEATPAKALFDFIYFRLASLDEKEFSSLESLRINWSSCDQKILREFCGHIKKSGIRKMNALLPLLKEVYHGNFG